MLPIALQCVAVSTRKRWFGKELIDMIKGKD